MTIKDLCKKYGISLRHCMRLCRREDFPAIKIGRKWVIDECKESAWFDEEQHRQKSEREEYVPTKEVAMIRGALGDWSKIRRYEDREKRLRGYS